MPALSFTRKALSCLQMLWSASRASQVRRRDHREAPGQAQRPKKALMGRRPEQRALGRQPPRPPKPKHALRTQSSLCVFPPMSIKAPSAASSNEPALPSKSVAEPQAPPASKPLRLQSSKWRKIGQSSFKNDHLGKIVVQPILAYCQLKSWPRRARKARGRKRLPRKVKQLRHCAATHLDRLCQQGAQAKVSGPAWSPEQLEKCVARGPHASAKERAEVARDKVVDFCDKGFWAASPFDLVKGLPNPCLSFL